MSSFKANKIFLKDDVESETCDITEGKINVYNAAATYNLSILYSLFSVSKLSLCYIERCFSMVADSNNFKELDVISVRKILSSDDLSIDSELQVYTAANSWLSYNINVRSKYARYLFPNIRLTLLSDHALKYLLSNISSTYRNERFVATINEVLDNNKSIKSNKLQTVDKVRFCNQSQFNVMLCGGHDEKLKIAVRKVFSIDLNNLNNVKPVRKMKRPRQFFQAVCIKNEVYVVGDDIRIHKYSFFTNAWKRVGDMYDYRSGYCVCSFMDDVYAIGGSLKTAIKSCIRFNTKSRTWKEVAKMNEARYDAACTIFTGEVVVSGGEGRRRTSKTVEAYDHVADKWSYMPNMIKRRIRHKLVAVNNKLFVVGGLSTKSCEVFDSTSNKFVLLKPPRGFYKKSLDNPATAIIIGSKLVVFGNRSDRISYYDVDTNEWSEESFEISKKLVGYCCVKVPEL